ncbi:hypothetical protein IQ37_18555 [Chryseobacterium piperi]|uniref:SprT-like domain-containing protein n=1 Tax=Chryseobacterium piperi TaxID=558152 RepID=A0A086AFL1_9FLAO|nr:hypothetical protein [Chryseobacterium piperi]ASW75259.1 hypothetical protein CJF12_13825 [Chryseobacterium piperi]KFF15475.1 hypothetical protein IQ37_18555 [Chryseobacterium piperi]
MNFEQFNLHLNAYKEQNQIIDAANFLIHSFDLEHENFGGFGFREELSPNSMLLTAEGPLGHPQKVMIPKNLFDFDLNLVLNMIAHEMLHVRQKAPGNVIEDRNEREFQAYYEMLFHKVFPQIPDVSDFHRKFFGNQALEYYKRMGKDSPLQKKYAEQKIEVEQLIQKLS